MAWKFNAIADGRRPSRSPRNPRRRRRGSLLLAYKMEDDYGVVDAQATFERKAGAGCRRASRRIRCSMRPNFTLVLPQARTRSGAGQTTKDLTEHPWAGVDVMMTLAARDEANNEGRSEPHEMRLPRAAVRQAAAARADRAAPLLALDANARKTC